MGTTGDTNLIRIGRAYDSGAGTGQNQTFVAGIYGTELSGVVQQVFVDANGQLGTVGLGLGSGGAGVSGPGVEQLRAQQQRVRALEATNAELLARLSRLEARLAALADGR